MTRQILFIQGGGDNVHDGWDNRLADSLKRNLGHGQDVRYPRMPDEADPRYSPWKAALLREFDRLDQGAIVMGHSIGGTILIHALAEQPPSARLGGICLIAAPFIGEGGWPSDEITPLRDFSGHLPAGVPVFLYHGMADAIVPVAHVHLYAKAIPGAIVRTVDGGDHQLNNDMSEIARDIRSAG